MYKLLLLFLTSFPFYMFAQSPVDGDDLQKALGQRQSTTMVSQLKDYIGEDYINKGAQIIISNSKLTRIDLYNEKNALFPDMKAFNGDLPLGLKFTNTIFETKKILSEGYEEEGDKAGTYTLIKDFPLNDLDSWTINIMYSRGRLGMISMIYVERGRADAESAEMVSRTGLSGEDYFLMIRKNLYNFQVKMLLEQMGYPDYSKKNVKVYLEKGFELRLSKAKTVEKLIMHPKGSLDKFTGERFKQYPLALPFGIKFSDTRQLAIDKCGPPKKQDGNSLTYFEQNAEMKLFFSGNTLSRIEINKPNEED